MWGRVPILLSEPCSRDGDALTKRKYEYNKNQLQARCYGKCIDNKTRFGKTNTGVTKPLVSLSRTNPQKTLILTHLDDEIKD